MPVTLHVLGLGMVGQQALALGLRSPGDDPNAPPPPPLRSDMSLALQVGQIITKPQAKASAAMYEATSGGKRFAYSSSK
jgi:hypothetical protein